MAGPTTGPTIGDLRQAYLTGDQRPSDVVADVLARIAARGDDGTWISVVQPAALLARASELEDRDDPRTPPLRHRVRGQGQHRRGG